MMNDTNNQNNSQSESTKEPAYHSVLNIFLLFLRLGLTSFGGPVAHIGYFREEFVARKKWLSDHAYTEIVALCQFLPGPASSQVGLAIGMSQAGYRGALAAWLGFTLPSAIAITLFAFGLNNFDGSYINGIVRGLKIVAVAIVAQAVWGMAKSLCTGITRKGLAIFAALIVINLPSSVGQIGAIVVCGLLGVVLINKSNDESAQELVIQPNKKIGLLFLSLFLPLLSWLSPSQTTQSLASFYQAGSLVFGGGHVVLPLLQAEVVSNGLVSNETFLAGYGAAQAVPGPLFTFASFLGASIYDGNMGWYGSLLCLFAIFLPAFLLIAGAFGHQVFTTSPI